MKIIFANVVELVMRTSNSEGVSGEGLKINYSLAGAAASDAEIALKLAQTLQPGRTLEIYHNGNNAGKIRLGSVSPEIPSDLESNEDRYTEELLDDLLALQRMLPSATFTVPETLDPRHRVLLRVARIILEGGRTYMPPGAAMTAMISGNANDGDLDFFRDGGPYVHLLKAFVIEIQGSKYNLGPAKLFHNNVEAVDSEGILKSIEDGDAEGLSFTLRPRDDQPIQVWLGAESSKVNTPPSYEPWHLTGFDVPFPESLKD